MDAALNEKKVKAQKAMALVRQANKAATAAASSLKKKRAQYSDSRGISRSRARLSESIETERASTRVGDVVGALRKVAERRREQLNAKRSSAASTTYIQSLPGLPTALKKSLWHKMHRRRQQIVLRPNMDSILQDMKESVEATAYYAQERSASRPRLSKEEISLRAEELFLLASFPEQGSTAPPSTPPPDIHAPWAEPGWNVDLSVPDEESCGAQSLLPRVHVSSVFQKNHSEFCSAPGRQAASVIKPTSLQALCTPLSSATQAISLAELNPAGKDCEFESLNLSPRLVVVLMSPASCALVLQQKCRSAIRSTFLTKSFQQDTPLHLARSRPRKHRAHSHVRVKRRRHQRPRRHQHLLPHQ